MSEEEYSQREMIYRSPEFKGYVDTLKKEVDLGVAWRNIMDGKATREEGQRVIVDLLLESGYMGVAPPNATGDMLLRQEGRREIMARIFFLADLPSSVITRLRRDALDELQKLESGQHD